MPSGKHLLSPRGLARAIVIALAAMLGGVSRAEVSPLLPGPDEIGGYASTHIVVRCSMGAAMSADFAAKNIAWNATHCRPAFTGTFCNPQVAAQLGLDAVFVVQVPAGTDTLQMAGEYALLPGVHDAFVDGVGTVATIPNDPMFSRQWNLRNTIAAHADIDAAPAWDLENGLGDPVVVAIVDSGVSRHVEFASRMVAGINTNDPTQPNLTEDECALGNNRGHGTHVAGIVAAAGNNGIGIAGIHWGVAIMPVRTLSGCFGTEVQAADGIVWAVDHGAEIINVSLQFYGAGSGGQQAVAILQSAVEYAHQNGVLVVAAAGNDEGRVVAYPARFAEVIAVSAMSSPGGRWSGSNFGPEVDLAAPGDSIMSTLASPQYGALSGTSMAAPHVAGVAALIRSFRPSLSADEIRGVLIRTAHDLGPVGWDEQFGYGSVNAESALVELDIDLVNSVPPTGAIDARQPHELNGSALRGWREVRMDFSGDAYQLREADFAVSQSGGVSVAPSISTVAAQGRNSVTLTLDRDIEVGAWTTVTFLATGAGVRIGYLPGDVNGDGVSGALDILDLIDHLNGVGNPLPIWSTDLNRSEVSTPLDILRLVDLLNGAGEYDVFFDRRLPP